MTIDELLLHCVTKGASDLHLSAGSSPTFRIKGSLCPMNEHEALSQDDLLIMANTVMNEEQKAVLAKQRSLDIGYSLASGERYRINIYYERATLAFAIRWLQNSFLSFDQLGLPPQLKELTRLHHGLVLVTGPTGSGKTTSLSTLLHQINLDRACHILTIEDPIEHMHENHTSMVHQRELHTDVPDFSSAVRAAMREDPDVILVGEMRDLETMRASLMAAETGHLVFSTLHTGDAVGVLERIVGSFSGEEQESIKQQLSMVLRAVVAQHLLPAANGVGRVPVVEILMVTSAVSNLIRSGKSQQLVTAMESGRAQGMQTIDVALADVVNKGLVRLEVAKTLCRDEKLFNELLTRHAKNKQYKD